MNEIGPVKQPEDEKSPKKKSVKAGFLASWIKNRENSGEGDAVQNEADLANPEEDSQWNDGFSKRWHKLFSGNADDATDDNQPDNTSYTVTSSTDEPKPKAAEATEKVADKPINDQKSESDLEAVRKQILEASKPSVELTKLVHDEQSADNLTGKEITANVPSKSTVPPANTEQQANPDEKLAENPDQTKEVKTNATEVTATNKSTQEQPKELFPRVDPSEFNHLLDHEDNVDAPGAPTKGYRGLLVVDHDDDSKTKTTVEPSSTEPQLNLPPIYSQSTVVNNAPAHFAEANNYPNRPAYIAPGPVSHTVSGTGGRKLDRQLQSLIDRPADTGISEAIIAVSDYLKQSKQSASQVAPAAEEKPAQQQPESADEGVMKHDEPIIISAENPTMALEQKPVQSVLQTPSNPAETSDKPQVSEQVMPIKASEETSEGAVPLAEVIINSPLFQKATVATVHKPAAPAPIYTPPKPSPVIQPIETPKPIMQIPVVDPGLYAQAARYGFVAGLLVTLVIGTVYLFG